MSKRSRENSVYARYVKNIFDRIFALLFLCLFWWVYLVCAGVILADSGHPVIYRQVRAGQYGRPFRIYKFRTMVKNADQIGPASTGKEDPRITRVGRILRETSLDELPQIFNILKGDMSFVGVRPDVIREDEDYSSDRYKLKPGITGLAQVNGRSALSKEEKRYWDEIYVYKVSLLTDIRILVRTVGVVFSGKGSN